MKTKNILTALLFMVFIAYIPLNAQKKQRYDRGTANYYLQEPERHEGKSVSIFVLNAGRTNFPAPEEYTAFMCQTSSPRTVEGGSMLVYVRTLRAKAFEEKYQMGLIVNGVPQTKQMSGKFIKAVGDNKAYPYAIMMN